MFNTIIVFMCTFIFFGPDFFGYAYYDTCTTLKFEVLKGKKKQMCDFFKVRILKHIQLPSIIQIIIFVCQCHRKLLPRGRLK